MILTLSLITLVATLVIVLVVAWYLVGIYTALKRGADTLEKLAGGLVAIRDNTRPLNGHVDDTNTRLSALVAPLVATNGNLAAIVKVAQSRS